MLKTTEAIDLYYPEMAKITAIEELTEKEKCFKILLPDGKPLNHKPGQFVEVSIFGFGEAPISICSSPLQGPEFELTIRNAGRLTDKIHRMKSGEKIGIRGPFGNGFNVDNFLGKDLLYIAGGIGLAPLKSLIDTSIERREEFGRIIILYGSKSPEEMMFLDDLKKWENRDDIEYFCTVDQADEKWKGNSGVITTLIPQLDLDLRNTMVSIVGPPIMYKFVLMALKGKRIPHENIYMSLERRMKCGVGKCGHCQINHSYVCQDGPVYHYPTILQLEEAI